MNAQLRKLPIGIQTFENIRREGYVYVDKTALIYRLVTTGKPYFLSRPRRFGKSLLLSTLESYFEGRRELFEGLAIADLEEAWQEYPVLHLDLNAEKYDAPEQLGGILNRHLNQWEDRWGREEFFRPFFRHNPPRLRTDGAAGGSFGGRIRQTSFAGFAGFFFAGGIPQDAESLLRGVEEQRPLPAFCIPDGGD